MGLAWAARQSTEHDSTTARGESHKRPFALYVTCLGLYRLICIVVPVMAGFQGAPSYINVYIDLFGLRSPACQHRPVAVLRVAQIYCS